MRILISRTDKIGDLLLTTPIISAVKKKYKDSYLAVLVSSYAKDVVEDNPFVNQIIVDENNSVKLVKMLKYYRFDTAVILYPRFHITLACYFARIPLRIGTAYRWYSFLFNKKIYIHRSRVEKHEVEYNFDLVKPLGVTVANEPTSIFYSIDDEEYAKNILKKFNLNNSKFIIVHPGSGGSAYNWSVFNYAKLIILLQNKNIRVLVTGGEKDKGVIEEVIKEVKIKPPFIVGETTIKQFAAIISKAELFISGSTGPMHLASAVSTTTLSFFPSDNKVMSPLRWKAWKNNAITFSLDTDVEKVFNAIVNIIK